MSEVTVKIGGDARGLSSTVAKSKALISAFKRSAGSAIGGAVSFATSPITAGLAAIGGLLTSGILLFKALNTAAANETAITAFTTLLGSAVKAQEMVRRLIRWSDQTPFQSPEVLDAARSLLAFGVAAEDVQKLLQKLGDISAATGSSLDDLARLYGRMLTAGRLSAREVNELTRRGIPIIHEIAKQYGIADTEVRKLIETGTVGFPVVEKAIDELTKTGGRFGGGIQMQSRTINGMLTTMHDRFNAIYRAIGTPINDALKPVLVATNKFLDGSAHTAQRVGATVGHAIGMVVALFQASALGTYIEASLKVGFGKGVNAFVGMLRGAVNALLVGIGGGFLVLFSPTFWDMVFKGAAAAMFKFGVVVASIFKQPVDILGAGFAYAIQTLLEGFSSFDYGVRQAVNYMSAGFALAGQELVNIIAKIPTNPFNVAEVHRTFKDFKGDADRANDPRRNAARKHESFGDLLYEQQVGSQKLIGQGNLIANQLGSDTKGDFSKLLPAIKTIGGLMSTTYKADAGSVGFVDTRQDEATVARLSKAAEASIAAKTAAQQAIDDKAEKERVKNRAKAELPLDENAAQEKVAKSDAPTIAADALARIGGGGNVAISGVMDRALKEAQTQTTLLKQIATNTGGGVPAAEQLKLKQ